MFKIIFAGMLGGVLTVTSVFATLFWKKSNADGAAVSASHSDDGMDQIKTKQISIPVIGDDLVEGYMRVQFAFSASRRDLDKSPVKPDIILVDEAYRSMAEVKFENPRRPSRHELDSMVDDLKVNIAKRLGDSIVKDIWIQDFDYVPATFVRSR